MAVATYTKSGSKATTPAKLNKAVFGVAEANHDLLKQAYVAHLANGRDNLAVTKRRGEVRGGGRKPWRQKGTGRARFGSSRNPIWRGGGIVFGPTGEEVFTKKMNVKAKRAALRQSLSIASTENRLIVIEDLTVKDNKTAEAAKLLSKVGATGKALILTDMKTVELTRAFRNLSSVKLSDVRYLSVFEVLNSDQIVITTKALQILTEWLTPTDTKEAK